MTLTLVAAVADNGVIGDGPRIPWRIPGEQAEFKELTLGHTLLMGRTTYDSIGRPLPGRTTVVLTRDPDWHAEGVLVAHDVPAALAIAAELPGEAMVVGGAQVYAATLPYADVQVITRVHLEPTGDVRYPDFDLERWHLVTTDPPRSGGGIEYQREWWESERTVAPSTPGAGDGPALR